MEEIIKFFTNNILYSAVTLGVGVLVFVIFLVLTLKAKKGVIEKESLKALENAKLSQENTEEKVENQVNETNKEVVVEWGVDSDIIAGLIFNIDEMIIDNSIRHKLEDLSKEIIKG